ncbi:transglycosylase SLT domain-containing protein [Aliihoeflea aestuarii]|jgi:soluble lytic murein transglycosylase-like protein|uniref:lytic transglycosylase domain-containing protein n=1 Tax=Aliihoeflea aestuarii TaxID=453840 RepID=UPI0020961CF8|nr:transglycosylase SLT domain-containing protein [Aliihoeflea aestuarii]MCO6392236.1 transglycosylase SLT domain-containing protein [Aliihoeflea aestuarii]
MKKLTVAAAALAAGMTSFASLSLADKDFAAVAESKANIEAMRAEKAQADELPGVDMTTTASVAATQAAAAKTNAVKGGTFGPIIAKYAAQHGVPAELAHAVVQVESNFRPNVTGGAGEVGLMQIKPATARMMGYSGSVKGLYDPEVNIRYGMKYLAMAQSVGDGTMCGTILKYNAGHAAKRMNPISANYCAKVQRIIGGAA